MKNGSHYLHSSSRNTATIFPTYHQPLFIPREITQLASVNSRYYEMLLAGAKNTQPKQFRFKQMKWVLFFEENKSLVKLSL